MRAADRGGLVMELKHAGRQFQLPPMESSIAAFPFAVPPTRRPAAPLADPPTRRASRRMLEDGYVRSTSKGAVGATEACEGTRGHRRPKNHWWFIKSQEDADAANERPDANGPETRPLVVMMVPPNIRQMSLSLPSRHDSEIVDTGVAMALIA